MSARIPIRATHVSARVPLSRRIDRSTTVPERHMTRMPTTARPVLRSPSAEAAGLVSGSTAVTAVIVAMVLPMKNVAM